MSKHRADRDHVKVSKPRLVPAHNSVRTTMRPVAPIYYPNTWNPAKSPVVPTGIGGWIDGLTPEDAKHYARGGN